MPPKDVLIPISLPSQKGKIDTSGSPESSSSGELKFGHFDARAARHLLDTGVATEVASIIPVDVQVFPSQITLDEIAVESNLLGLPFSGSDSGRGRCCTGSACTNCDKNSPTPRTECRDSPCNTRYVKSDGCPPPPSEGRGCTDLCPSVNICADP
jgi:hypothetical protein